MKITSLKYLACDHCGRAVRVDVQAIRCLCSYCAPHHRIKRYTQEEFLYTPEPATSRSALRTPHSALP